MNIMKRNLSIFLTILMLLSVAVVLPAFADETVTGQTDAPEWIITEIANDTAGNDANTNGYPAVNSKDVFEFIEIYNNSGRELDLYDYALTYDSATRDSENFENRITESTPIKGGDYLDGFDLVPDEGQAVFGDLSLKPVNPDTCLVAPGEVVVLWMVYYGPIWPSSTTERVCRWRISAPIGVFPRM